MELNDYRVDVAPKFHWLIAQEGGWQVGETGVLSAIVDCLRDLPQTCIEFGSGDGKALPVTVAGLINRGWKARLMDANAANADSVRALYPIAEVIAEVVTPETISLVDGAFSEPATVLVVDIDSADIEIVRAMRSRPAVVMVEHRDEFDEKNPRVPYVPETFGGQDRDGYHIQANSPAVAEVMAEKGYVPVWVSRYNGVYVRGDVSERVARNKVDAGGAPLRLNIGGGNVKIDGFTTVDKANGTEAYPLQWADNSADEIRASHILEHFPMAESHKVLKEWVRVLKPGGRIRISVPDITKVAREIAEPKGGYDPTMVLYGGQSDQWNYHKTGFDEVGLLVEMQRAGLVGLGRFNDDVPDTHYHPASCNLEGYKPTEKVANAAYLRKIRGVQSVPRLLFTEQANCTIQTVRQLGIDVHMMQGAFWGQCLERGFDAAIASGCEWILTFDYDTVFSVSDIEKMAMLLEQDPTIDAMAPLQLRRGDDNPILNAKKEAPDLSQLRGPVTDATMAHFGCTLIRVSALKKMARPWFWGQPGKDNKWEEGRLDDDVYFWKKFIEAGNRLCVASRVSVGHMQLLVTWPDEYCRPIRQHVHQFNENGPPVGRRH